MSNQVASSGTRNYYSTQQSTFTPLVGQVILDSQPGVPVIFDVQSTGTKEIAGISQDGAGTFTVDIEGLYTISCSISFPFNILGTRQCWLNKGASLVRLGENVNQAVTNGNTFVQMNYQSIILAGETFKIFCELTAAGADLTLVTPGSDPISHTQVTITKTGI